MGFFGHATEKLENDTIYLEYLIHGGPRIVRLVYKPTQTNLFAEIPDVGIDTPSGKYMMLGGHRLWASPESVEFTYILDDKGLQVKHSGSGVDLIMPGLPPVFHHKQIHLSLDSNKPIVHLMHSIRNDSTNTVIMAAWGITQLKPGGTAIFPLRMAEKPGSMLLPDRSVTLWPYTQINDPHLSVEDDKILVNDKGVDGPMKFGGRNPQGWIAYLLDGMAFIKRSPFDRNAEYPDYGCNTEIYTNGKFLELESLSGLITLEPGRWVNLEEEWEIRPYTGSAASFDAGLAND